VNIETCILYEIRKARQTYYNTRRNNDNQRLRPKKKETWTTIAEVWAKIDQRPGKDSEKSESRFFSRPVTFVVRFRDDIGPDDRVSFDGKIYRIESVNEVHYSRRRWMNLRCVILGRQDG